MSNGLWGRGVWLVLLLAVLVASCATGSAGSPEATVRQRAQARWAALIAGEWNDAYAYMVPSYRALIPRNRFVNQFGGGGAWLDAEVVDVSCKEEDKCSVRMKVSFRPVLGGRSREPVTTHFDETWVREDGQWWMFQKI
jgi:hypothetical protein